MDRYSIILPPDDKIRPTNRLGTYGRCIRWNFADDWFPFQQGVGLPPHPRELWLPVETEYTEAMHLLVIEAKQEREKLLQSLSGLPTGINIIEGEVVSAKDVYEEQAATARKQSLLIAPGASLPVWKGKQ